ncbi:solute carrier family 49 member 4-like [Amphiura filiformis]|uniref:solute carrier family 49 member 4-like n=1 Tax=Amphiura filiformis TaxID=82378 RepID=UPI003B20D9C2
MDPLLTTIEGGLTVLCVPCRVLPTIIIAGLDVMISDIFPPLSAHSLSEFPPFISQNTAYQCINRHIIERNTNFFLRVEDNEAEYDDDPYIQSTYGTINQQTSSCMRKTKEFIVYKRRWYILALFSVAAATQTALWNTWGPIADTVKAVLGWTDADIALLTIWGGVVFAVTVIPFSTFMDSLGLRRMFLLAQTMSLLGVGVRCLPVGVHNLKYTANAGQFLIAIGGPVLMSGPPLLSAQWFPPNQRTTATAISSSAPALGVAVSFLFGPAIVNEIKTTNYTDILPANLTTSPTVELFEQDFTESNSTVTSDHIREIYTLLYIDLIWLACQFFIACIYFPSKPPTPPSLSADKERENFWNGVKYLIRSQYFWIPGLAFSVSLGVFNAWITQVDTMFQHTVQVGQKTVGWIGFFTNIASACGGLLAGRCVDFLGGKMKLVLLTLTSMGILCFVWFVLLCYGVIQFNLASLYISCVSYGLLLNSAMPIYFEMTVEGVYPVAEGIATGSINWLYNLTGLIFLFVMLIPDIGVLWMNWAVLGAILVTIPLLAVYKEQNKRLQVDTHKETM